MLRTSHLFSMVATALATAVAASAQMLPPAPTVTPVSVANLQLAKVTSPYATNPNLAAYTGTGAVNIGGKSVNVLVTLTTQKVLNNGIGVINGAINMADRTTGLMLTGRLLGTITPNTPVTEAAPYPTLTVEGAQRTRSLTVSAFTPPQLLRGSVTIVPNTLPGVTVPGALVNLDGVLMTMSITSTGTMSGMGG